MTLKRGKSNLVVKWFNILKIQLLTEICSPIPTKAFGESFIMKIFLNLTHVSFVIVFFNFRGPPKYLFVYKQKRFTVATFHPYSLLITRNSPIVIAFWGLKTLTYVASTLLLPPFNL